LGVLKNYLTVYITFVQLRFLVRQKLDVQFLVVLYVSHPYIKANFGRSFKQIYCSKISLSCTNRMLPGKPKRLRRRLKTIKTWLNIRPYTRFIEAATVLDRLHSIETSIIYVTFQCRLNPVMNY
jgi:hypothetical protein